MGEEYLTTRQAAKKCKVCTRTIYNWIWAGKLETCRMHGEGKHLIPRAEIENRIIDREGFDPDRARKKHPLVGF